MKQKIYDIQNLFFRFLRPERCKDFNFTKATVEPTTPKTTQIAKLYYINVHSAFMLIVEFLMKLNEKIRQKTKDMSCFNKTKEEHFFI